MSWLKHLVAVALICLSVAPVAAASFGEIAAWCTPPDAGGRPALCSGYLETYLQALASPDPSLNNGARACVPETEDRSELMLLIQAYARASPSSESLSGIAGVGEALKDRYPCR